MKKYLILCILLLCAIAAFTQGVNFDTSSPWQQVLKKAKDEHKLIFIDCYATWCAPCKAMDNEVFNQQIVGDLLNRKFVCIKAQFDSSAKDNDDVKRRRSIVRELESKYQINSFPTYLFLDENGEILTQKSGAILPADSFLLKIREVLNPDNQYYTLRKRFQAGDTSSLVIRKLLPEAVRLRDWNIAYAAHNLFVRLLNVPYLKEDMIALCSSIPSSDALGFLFLRQHGKQVDEILNDEGRSGMVIRAHINREAFDMFIKEKKVIDWDRVYLFLKTKSPELAERSLLELKIHDAKLHKDWEKYGELKMDYYDTYAWGFDHNSRWFMNNELMEIFINCKDSKTLKRACKWSKSSIYLEPGKENPAAMDTYANLLYKLGKKSTAIKWQEKAVSLIKAEGGEDVQEYQANLHKMYNDQPTW